MRNQYPADPSRLSHRDKQVKPSLDDRVPCSRLNVHSLPEESQTGFSIHAFELKRGFSRCRWFRECATHRAHLRIPCEMASRSFMPLRRSLAQLSASSSARPAGRHAGRSVRSYATEHNSRRRQQFTVWRPYLRLAIGVPFIGAIIYSMVGREP